MPPERTGAASVIKHMLYGAPSVWPRVPDKSHSASHPICANTREPVPCVDKTEEIRHNFLDRINIYAPNEYKAGKWQDRDGQ